MRSRHALLVLILMVFVSSAVLTGCAAETPEGGSTQPEASPTPAEVEPEGADLVAEKCSRCHSLERVETADKDATQWETTVERMKTNGLQVTDEEQQAIVAYLAERDSRK